MRGAPTASSLRRAQNKFLRACSLHRTPILSEWDFSSPNPGHEKSTFSGALIVAALSRHTSQLKGYSLTIDDNSDDDRALNNHVKGVGDYQWLDFVLDAINQPN